MIAIDPLSDSTLNGAVALHRQQIAKGFLTLLGPGFLREVFWNIARSRYGVAVVATEDDSATVTGYLLGSTDLRGLYRDFLRRHGLRAVVAASPHLVHPTVALKAVETLLYPSKRIKLNPSAPRNVAVTNGELLDLAVDNAHKGSGLAQELFHRFAAEMARRGSPSFRITTAASLTRAHRFYERLGADLVGEIEIHRGELTRVYVYDPSPAEHQPSSPASADA